MNAVADQSASDPREQPIARYELWAVVAITLLGAAVRFAFPSAMAIEHFDEGVYASNLLFPDQGFRYPDRHLYAPSFVPALIEWSIILFGDKGIAPMLPSLLFGTLTIPLIWWVGRQWFGPLSGIAAATLLSLSDFHIAFSRSALTDVPLCFWLLLAVYLFERSFRDLSWWAAIFAGLTTGLAWWTKYNGWLPLAISLSGLLAWSLFARRDERHFLRHLSLWAIAAAIALVVWSSYWLSLPHGYAEVAHNHSQYVMGLASWSNGAIRQFEALEAFNCPLSWGSLAMFFVGSSLLCEPNLSALSLRFDVRAVVIGIVFIFVFVFTAITFALLTANLVILLFAFFVLLVGLSMTTVDSLKTRALTTPNFFQLRFRHCDWLLTAWAVGLTLTTPLYRPYPRLVLPWTVAVALFFSMGNDGRRKAELPFVGAARQMNLMEFLVVAVLMCSAIWTIKGPLSSDAFQFRCWEPRNQFRQIARDVTGEALKAAQAGNQKAIQNTHAVLYVYAEPGLFFHLPADGLAVQPAGNLSFVNIEATRKLPTFLITGPHAHRSPAFADEFAKRADQFELIASYPYDASDFVRLDDVSATQLRTHREPLEVRLYRVRVPE